MGIQTVINQVLIIFILILVGYATGKLGFITREVRRGLIELLVNLAIPSLVIASFDTELQPSMLTEAGLVFAFAAISMTLSALAARFIYRHYPAKSKTVLAFVAVFTNCAFMGYPVMESIFGSHGIFLTSIYSIVFNTFLWTYGRVLFNGADERIDIKRVLLNAGTLAVVAGLVLLLTPLSLPPVAASVFQLIGSLTTPLAMLVIGSMLSEVRLREIFHGRGIFKASVLRLLVFPALSYAVLRALGISAELAAICTVLTGMPAASNAVIFAEKFGGDAQLATRIVVITTALSILTVPMMVVLLR
jgi:hypothetical protein